MPPAKALADSARLTPKERRYHQAGKRLDSSLTQLKQAVAAFKESAGERQSVIVLDKALQATARARPAHIFPVNAAAIAESLLWSDELKHTVLAREILDDLELEAQEGAAEPAARLLACLRQVEDAVEAYREAHAGLVPQLQKEDSAMIDGDPPKTAKPIRIRVTTDASGGGAAAGKVQAQMVATLDSFGLPHRDGLLESGGSDAPRLASRLMETLGRRFAVRDDPMNGLRAEPRRYSIYERSGISDEDLAGRFAIAADVATATVGQIGITLDDLLELSDQVEEWPINEPTRVDAVRARVDRQLDILRELARKPSGPPAPRCDYELDMLQQAIVQLLAALGLKSGGVSPADWNRVKGQIQASIREQLPDLGATVSDELSALIDQLFDQVTALRKQLIKQEGATARSEASYHLRRILEAIATQVEATRADMEESPASAAWVGARLKGAAGAPPRYLADELEGALNWLEELAATYGLSDRAYEEMRPAAVSELRGALGTLATVIGTCRKELKRLDVPEDDDVVERLGGLHRLIASAQSLAQVLGGGTGGSLATGAGRSPKQNRSRETAS